jgi:Ran GTPase-activating protein (RanGAP) involved in mRNA processing and transport
VTTALALHSGSKITAIRLSTKSIGEEAVAVVIDAIHNNTATLADADISDIIAGRPEAEVLSVLRQVSAALKACSLAELNISDNALGEKGVRACAEAMASQQQLRALYLQNIGCSVNACKAVNELVQCGSLEKVHLFNNMSDDEGAKSIAALLGRSPHMQARHPPAHRTPAASSLALPCIAAALCQAC